MWKGWVLENSDGEGEAICPHRDLSVCEACQVAHEANLVEVFGKFFWVGTPEEKAALVAALAAV